MVITQFSHILLFLYILSHPPYHIKSESSESLLLIEVGVLHLAGLGGEQLVKFGVFREVIREGQDDIVEEQQAVARLGVGHIGKLLR